MPMSWNKANTEHGKKTPRRGQSSPLWTHLNPPVKQHAVCFLSSFPFLSSPPLPSHLCGFSPLWRTGKVKTDRTVAGTTPKCPSLGLCHFLVHFLGRGRTGWSPFRAGSCTCSRSSISSLRQGSPVANEFDFHLQDSGFEPLCLRPTCRHP